MISECHDSFAYRQQRHPPQPPTPCRVPPVPSLAQPSLASPSSLYMLPERWCTESVMRRLRSALSLRFLDMGARVHGDVTCRRRSWHDLNQCCMLSLVTVSIDIRRRRARVVHRQSTDDNLIRNFDVIG